MAIPGFSTSDSQLLPMPGTKAYEIITSADLLGDTLWDYGPEYYAEEATKHLKILPELGVSIRNQVGMSQADLETTSVAMIDWTSLDNARRLMENDTIFDPFVSLLDLSSVVSALIFYDKIIVLEDSNSYATNKVSDLMGIQGAIRNVDPYTLRDDDDRMQKVLNAHFVAAIQEMDGESSMPNSDAPWIEWLADYWKKLLPIRNFPRHDWDAYDTNFGYTLSPDRKSGCKVIFEYEGPYNYQSDYSELILDNDARALFYEYLSRMFSHIIYNKATGSVRYIGGCLRIPMLLTRARLAEAKLEGETSVEEWLQMEWKKKKLDWNKEYAMRLPFWMDSVLSDANNPGDFADAVKEFRKKAEKFRKNKLKFEKALYYGNSDDTKKLEAALQGDIERLSGSVSDTLKTSLDVAVSAGKIVAPMIPTDLIKSLSNYGIGHIGKNWFEEMGLRLFRPQLWFVYSMGKSGRRLQRSTQKGFEIFSLKTGIVATKPAEFLSKFGELQLAV